MAAMRVFLFLSLATLASAEMMKVLKSNQSLSESDKAVDGIKLIYNENPKFEDFTLCMRFNFKSLYKDIVSIKKGVNSRTKIF